MEIKEIKPNQVYSLKEVSYILALSPRTIYKLIKKGGFKGWKAGKQWRFLGRDLIALFDVALTGKTV